MFHNLFTKFSSINLLHVSDKGRLYAMKLDLLIYFLIHERNGRIASSSSHFQTVQRFIYDPESEGHDHLHSSIDLIIEYLLVIFNWLLINYDVNTFRTAHR